MRGLRRFVRRLVAEWRIRKRREAVRRQIEVKLSIPVRFVASGSRGADSIYRVMDEDRKCIAVLRLINPHRKQKIVSANMPYRVLSGEARIQRELESYQTASVNNLSPALIWHSNDALLCRFEAGLPIIEELRNGSLSPVAVLQKGWAGLHALHQLGITHMDASIQNILYTPKTDHISLVDFEFGASENISFETQCLYDYLRYLESMMKFLGPQSIEPVADYLSNDDFAFMIIGTTEQIDLLTPALERLKESKILWPVLLNMLGRTE